MGCSFLFSSCSNYEMARDVNAMVIPEIRERKATGNPDPKNFQITRVEKVGRFLVVQINYPDCKNYEGNKILVYEDMSINRIASQSSIDPHFCEHKSHPSPIARFCPTEVGWNYAVKFCKSV